MAAQRLQAQRSLRDALRKVLDSHDRYAKATMSYQNARDNFSDSSEERKAHERAMLAACDAEREARVLLLTLRDVSACKPLTDEQIDALAMDEDGLPNSHLELARAVELAHGIGA